jgi:hypothetical protein
MFSLCIHKTLHGEVNNLFSHSRYCTSVQSDVRYIRSDEFGCYSWVGTVVERGAIRLLIELNFFSMEICE